MEDLAENYSKYLKLDVIGELLPIHQVIDEMITRLEEFETLINVIQSNQDESSSKINPKLLEYKQEINTLHARINYLHIFINKVNDDMTLLEKQVGAAEAHFGVPDTTIKGFLKPFLAKINKEATELSNKSQPITNYTKPTLFKTTDYFPQEGSMP